ncbi:cocaine esterase-like isoform X1 [Genypterus blacodes]|uniref:cocaine esterase-like isoform X1 n=1 Tax=Genypterus blacodes TaxID=154954 RepID=UPI003F7715ED
MGDAVLGLCSVLVLFQCSQGTGSSGPVATLQTGAVRGHYRTVRGTEELVEEYLSIPFARPPLGPLRFAPPQTAEAWEGVRDATKMPKMCPQDTAFSEAAFQTFPVTFPSVEMSEDCLYLNVYRPSDTQPEEKLPVMVWIHGGRLTAGGAFQYDGSPLAAYQHVVVVVIQYRLSILGFLSTGDEHCPGNWGLLDQVASLQWVRDNIQAFNGDPKSVTVFGQSAGALSISVLVLSPLAEGLFHRGIAMSGVVPLEAHYTSDPMAKALMIANLTQCYHSNNEKLVQCVKDKSEEEILNAIKKFNVFLVPAIDGVFLKARPEELLKKHQVHKVPMIFGMTNHEFGWLLPRLFCPPGWQDGLEEQAVISVLDQFFPYHGTGVNEQILNEYLGQNASPEDVRDAFTEILGDLALVLPILKAAAYHRDAGATVYVYEFQHSPAMHHGLRPSFVKADHLDDMLSVLGTAFATGHTTITGPVTPEEEELSKAAMAYIGNFARTGSPNGSGLVRWPPYDQSENYLELNPQPAAGQRLKRNRARFLDRVLVSQTKSEL